MRTTPEQRLDQRKRAWWGWHKQNPAVWEQFERFSLEAAASGRRHYSAWAIIQRVRWHTTIETKGDDFKISNDYIAFYARFFLVRHPELPEFFVTKPFKEEKQILATEDSMNRSTRRRVYGRSYEHIDDVTTPDTYEERH